MLKLSIRSFSSIYGMPFQEKKKHELILCLYILAPQHISTSTILIFVLFAKIDNLDSNKKVYFGEDKLFVISCEPNLEYELICFIGPVHRTEYVERSRKLHSRVVLSQFWNGATPRATLRQRRLIKMAELAYTNLSKSIVLYGTSITITEHIDTMFAIACCNFYIILSL
ncbi:hypothetical protein ACJX0J_020857 [Zea mays]